MSALNETSHNFDPRNRKRRGIIALGISSLVVGGMLFGPSINRSYHQGQDIEHKRGPAKAYVTKTLGELVLDGQQLNFAIGEHECDNEPHYGPGDVSRHCSVHGESTYAFQAKDFTSAYDKANNLMRQRKVEQDKHTISYQGQNIEVAAGFTLNTGFVYNNSRLNGDPSSKVPDDDYIVKFDVRAFTVDYTAPDYPYNNDGP